jgi:hypothetical protein
LKHSTFRIATLSRPAQRRWEPRGADWRRYVSLLHIGFAGDADVSGSVEQSCHHRFTLQIGGSPVMRRVRDSQNSMDIVEPNRERSASAAMIGSDSCREMPGCGSTGPS